MQSGRCLITTCLDKDDKFVIMEMDVQNSRLNQANQIFQQEMSRLKDLREEETKKKQKEIEEEMKMAAEAEEAKKQKATADTKA